MDTFWTVAIALCSAILVSIGLNPVLIEISTRKGWYAKTNHRTIHSGKIPYIGGAAIFIAFVIGVAAAELAAPALKEQLPAYLWTLVIFGTCYAAVHYLGLIDDFVNVLARYKLLVQFAAAAVISLTGHNVEGIHLSAELTIVFGPFSHVITILWLMGVSNAVNLIDGMDGLSGVTSGLAAFFFGVTFLVLGNLHSAVLSFSLLGAIVGFLLFNWPRAKIFMGDNGALFLGFALASLPFLENSGIIPIEHIFIPLSLLFFPLFDTFMAISRRLRRGKPLHSPDKEHFHHKMIALGYAQGKILMMLSIVFLIPASTSLALLWVRMPYGLILVGTGWAVASGFFLIIRARFRNLHIPVATE